MVQLVKMVLKVLPELKVQLGVQPGIQGQPAQQVQEMTVQLVLKVLKVLQVPELILSVFILLNLD